MEKISITWGKLVGQNFAIVKIKDVREKEYLQEICKYVVEGSELAKWPAEHINEFVQAVRGLRMFNSFGSLRELAPEIRREINAAKKSPPPCDCGCGDFTYEDSTAVTVREVEKLEHLNARYSSRRVSTVAIAPVAVAIADTPAML